MSTNSARLPLEPSEIRSVPEDGEAVYMLWQEGMPRVVGTTDGRPGELRETLLGHYSCQAQLAAEKRATHFSYRLTADPVGQEITVAAAMAGYLPEPYSEGRTNSPNGLGPRQDKATGK
jgi:hypothetical protein